MGWTPPKTTEKGFIVNTETQETVRFQYFPVSLETISDTSYDEQDAKNMVPYQEWTGSSYKINFPLQFTRRRDFDTSAAIEMLRSFTEPRRVNGKLIAPPTCLVHIGSGEWKVKVRKVQVNYTAWTSDGKARDFDVMIETTAFMSVPKPPDKTKTKQTSTKAKEPEERPYAYLLEE